MTFFEILERFKNGEKIRRECWDKNLWMEFNKNSNLSRLYSKQDFGIKLLSIDIHYTTDDIMADDWCIYEQ